MKEVRICCNLQTRVIDSRDKINGVYRRRKCVKCGVRFSTLESYTGEQPGGFMVVHKNEYDLLIKTFEQFKALVNSFNSKKAGLE